MTLFNFIQRVSGTYRPNQHADLDNEISNAQEMLRLNTLAVESGARAIDKMKDDVLSNMSGMMRMMQKAERRNEE